MVVHFCWVLRSDDCIASVCEMFFLFKIAVSQILWSIEGFLLIVWEICCLLRTMFVCVVWRKYLCLNSYVTRTIFCLVWQEVFSVLMCDEKYFLCLTWWEVFLSCVTRNNSCLVWWEIFFCFQPRWKLTPEILILKWLDPVFDNMTCLGQRI